MPSSKRKVLFAALAVLLGTTAALGLLLLLVQLGVISGAPLHAWLNAMQNSVSEPSSRRVLVIGDSFLERWPFRSHLKGSIERHAHHTGVGAYVSAVRGTGPAEYLDRMKRLMPKIKPQQVIVFYYAGNDLTDVDRAGEGSDRPAVPEVIENETARDAPEEPAEQHIRMSKKEIEDAFNWQEMRSKGIATELIEMAKKRIETPNSVDHNLVNPHFLVYAMLFPRGLEDNILIDTVEARSMWHKTSRIFEEMIRLARAYGARMAIVVIPSMVQVDGYYHDLYKKAGIKVDARMLGSREPQRRLQQLCRKHGVRFLDLLPHFRKHPTRRSLYFRHDDHFTQEGHALAFDQLRRAILK